MKLLKSLIAISFFSLCLAEVVSAQVNITTWQDNLQHTGNNANETILTPGNISAPGNFGQLFSQPLDGQTYGQPLLMSGLSVNGSPINIVYVATEHCSIYAFNADTNVGPYASPIWHVSMLPTGCVPVPQSVVGSGDISIELGCTTTPVIDPVSNTIYIVSKVQRTSDTTYHQYLYAFDLTTGTTKFGSPVEINATFPGSSTDSSGGVIPFSALHEHTRAAMTLNNGVLYISYASHSDTTPYHGEVIGFNPTTLQQLPAQSFITTPNGMEGGIWGGGAGPAFDVSGSNMFVSIANGQDRNTSQYGSDWGESFLKIPTSGTLAVSLANTLNWFTPNNWNNLNGGDLDVGSGGVCILPDQTGPHTHIMVGGGKGAVLYVVDRDNLGGINTPDNAIQEIPEVGGDWLFMTPSYYNGYIYYAPSGGPLEQRAVGYNATNGSYIADPPVASTKDYGAKGYSCFISSSGATNGIVWILNGAGIDAYNASNVSGNPIFTANSTLPGNIGTQNTKFQIPIVANGKAYYTAFDSTNTGHLIVSGLLASGSGTPAAPSNTVAMTNSSSAVTVTWTNNATNQTGFSIQRSTTSAGPFTQVGTANAGVTTYTDTGLSPSTTYYYLVEAYNGNGASPSSNVASASTFPNYTVNGLVAYWNMDETAGTVVHDLTGNGHTGTSNGEALPGAGLINNGIVFHGNNEASNVVVPNTSALQFTANQSFTISTWAYNAAFKGTEQAVIAKSSDQGNYYGIWINAGYQWVFRGPGGDIVGPTVTANTWTHLAVVQDGVAGTRTMYVNGVTVATGTAQAGDGAGDLWMGEQNITGTLEGFGGTLDEVRLYNRALAATEITDLMGTPVVQASSVQSQGNAGTFSLVTYPSVYQVTEPREGSTVGSYKLVLNFSAPVSGISASLGLQNGGTAVGSVGTINYDSTGTIVTITLTGVGNLQNLDLHLSNVPSGSGGANGTQDIPFNILWGDANGDSIVSALDYSIVHNSHTALINSTSYLYDFTCAGTVTAADDSIVTAAIGNNAGPQTPTNLAVFQPTTALSVNGGNLASNAVDNNLATRWESTQGVDPEWIYVDLGSNCTINSVLIDWENAAGENYEIDVLSGTADPTVLANWTGTAVKTVTGNTTAGYHTYSGLNAYGRYVRMYGTMRDSPYGYSMYDYQVIGISGSNTPSAPVITGGLTVTGTTGTAFNYQITASNSPTSFTATGLPANLGINTATGAITGLPASSGTTSVTIGAVNTTGTGTATLTIGIVNPPPAPVITSASTASGTSGSAFTYQITAANSPASYSASGLPTGLSVNTATGAITGTPLASGTTAATINAINVSGTGSATLTISVVAPNLTPSITSATSITTSVGATFNYQIAATNTPTSFNATNLPSGLSVSTSSGVISGTATTTGIAGATISAINSSGTGSTTLTITVNPPGSGPPPVLNAATTIATVGVPFNYQVNATNSPTSYSANGLPAGLSINTSTGLITGSTAASGIFYSGMSASNAGGTSSAALTFVINSSSDINLALNQTIIASSTNGGNVATNAVDGNVGTRWESTQGIDPQWIYVDLGSVCYIHAVDIAWETAGGSNYLIQVSNDASNWTTVATITGNTLGSANGSVWQNNTGLTATGRYVRMYGQTRDTGYGYSMWEYQVWGIPGPNPAINSGTAAVGTVGSVFGYQIGATNNPLSYSATGLPAGLSLSSSGLISGTPTASGTTSVPITAANTSGTANATLTIGITAATASAPVFTSGTIVTGTAGLNITYLPSASNSPTSYNATGLPSGVIYSTGTVVGAPNLQGVSNATVTATNGSGATLTTVPIVVNPSVDSNLAFGKTATASTVTGGNAAANAFDENYTTRWDSVEGAGADPSYIYVDLGQTDTIHSVVIDWENSGGANYEIDVLSGTLDPTVAANWTGTAVVTVTGNTTPNQQNIRAYTGLNATGRYVRMYGTARYIQYGYSIWDMQVFGYSGTASPSPVINGSLAATGTNGSAFTYQIAATNTPTSYSASPLPTGLNVDTNAGVISGTPTVTGTTNVTIGATNAGGTGTATLVITVLPQPPVVNSTLAATGTNGSAFSYQIAATNSPASYNATGLPQGLSVDTNAGVISGTPTVTGTLNVTISAANPGGSGTATLVLAILPPLPAVNSALTATGTNGTAFSYQIAATNNPTSYNATGLPTGLNIDTNAGVISGTPTVTGTSNVTISAVNISGTGSATLVLAVLPPPPAINSTLSASGTAGSAFTYQIAATNSPTSYNASGLPAGLNVNTNTGAITGAPEGAGSTNASISAINISGTGTATLIIFVQPPAPVINSSLAATGTNGTAFSYQIAATNNPTSYNATGLPTGLAVDTNAGLISGTATVTGTSNVTISAMNGGGTGTANLVLGVQPPAPVITSSLSVSGTNGKAFGYQIVASNNPTSYGANGLPSGLTMDNSTGWISGTTTVTGTSNVTIKAMNISGTGSATLQVAIQGPTGIPALPVWALVALPLLLLFTGFRFVSKSRR